MNWYFFHKDPKKNTVSNVQDSPTLIFSSPKVKVKPGIFRTRIDHLQDYFILRGDSFITCYCLSSRFTLDNSALADIIGKITKLA